MGFGFYQEPEDIAGPYARRHDYRGGREDLRTHVEGHLGGYGVRAADRHSLSGYLRSTLWRCCLSPCEPVEGGTRLTHAVEYEPRGIYYKTIAPLMPLASKRLIVNMDRTLKDVLEGKTTSGPRPESATSGVAGSVVAGTVLAVSIMILFLLRRRRGASRRGRCFASRASAAFTSG